MTPEQIEKIKNCENCSKELFVGDLGMWATEGCLFCEDCAPRLSDQIAQHKEIIESRDVSSMDDLGYIDFAEMEHCLSEFEADLRDGDCSLARVLE